MQMLNARERKAVQAKHEAVELLGLIGLNRAARELDVSLVTVKRWYSGEVAAPGPVLIALRTLAGRWGPRNADWEGWTISDNWLWSPAGERYHPGDLLGQRYQRQLIKHLQRKVQLLEQKLRSINTGAANDPIEGDIAAPKRSYK